MAWRFRRHCSNGQRPATISKTSIHHRELARTPYPTRSEGMSYNLVPDAFLELRRLRPNGKFARNPILLEFDRGSQQRKRFRRKIRAYITMQKAQAYKGRFKVNTDSVTIAFTTFEGKKRREQLRSWTKEKLQSEAESLGKFFCLPLNYSHLMRVCGYLRAGIQWQWNRSQ